VGIPQRWAFASTPRDPLPRGERNLSTQIVHWGLEGRRMQWRASLDLTEKPIVGTMGDEEGPKWPSLRRMHSNSTAGAPNGQFVFNP
jgi:hypothetical protein